MRVYSLVQLKVFACSNTESRVHPFSTVLKMPVELQTVCVESASPHSSVDLSHIK